MRRRWRFPMLAAVCVLPLGLTACGASGPPDFTLALASGQAGAVNLTQGGTAAVRFQVSALKGSHGSITLTVSGLPTGVGIAPGTATVGIGSTQVFDLTAASSAPVTSAPVTLTATGVSGNPLDSSAVTHTQTVTVSVVAPAP